jgi:hypothetical protein
MDAPTIFAALSFGANIVLGLVVYSLKQTIRVAILEAVGGIKDMLTSDYATKDDLTSAETRLEKQIGLRAEIREGFARLEIKRRQEERT